MRRLAFFSTDSILALYTEDDLSFSENAEFCVAEVAKISGISVLHLKSWRRYLQRWRRIKMDFRDQVDVDLDAWILFLTLKNLTAAGFQFIQQLGQVNPFTSGNMVLQILPAAEVQLFCAARVAIAKMMQANRDLN